MELHTTTPPEDFDAFELENNPSESPAKGRIFTAEERLAGMLLRKEKIAAWTLVHTRQDFADERWMRGITSAAGVRSPLTVEPATVKRLRSVLRRAGVQTPEILEAVGTSLEGFLALNPNLPLWAALALVLESTGKFDTKAAEIADEGELALLN